ncbi:hypothetical protein Tco_0442620 [Tanacetum coccineum]
MLNEKTEEVSMDSMEKENVHANEQSNETIPPKVGKGSNSDEISALASRTGRHMVMDSMTANMCKLGIGKVEHARVLVEVDAKKALLETVEVVYKNDKGEIHCRKSVIVMYDWKPPRCNTCSVFGHATANCGLKEVNGDYILVNNGKEINNKEGDINEGFVEAKNRKNERTNGKVNRYFKSNNQPMKGIVKGNGNEKVGNKIAYQVKSKGQEDSVHTPTKVAVQGENMKKNKGAEEGVLIDDSDIAQCMEGNEMKGLSSFDKQKEVKNFILKEKLQVCVVLETHLKRSRIMGGWNVEDVNVNVTHVACQSIMLSLDVVCGKFKVFASLIYVANGRNEGRELWKDLQIYKSIVGSKP